MEESDIIDLEKRYWLLKAQSRTGRFDLETFGPLVSPPIHPSLSEGMDPHKKFSFVQFCWCGFTCSKILIQILLTHATPNFPVDALLVY